MANTTYTSEDEPVVGAGAAGLRWYKPSTHGWFTYNGSTGVWDLDQDGFDTVKVVDLAISGSCTSGGDEGITGEYEGTFKKAKVVNGIITEFEVE